MNHEDLILSEYLDGELPLDIAQGLERRLQDDAALRQRLAALDRLRLPEPAAGAFDVQAAQVRVWNRLEWSTRGKIRQSTLRRAGDFFRRRVSLPLPAFAAMALVVGVLGLVAVLRGGQDGAGGITDLARNETGPVMYRSLGNQAVSAAMPVAETALDTALNGEALAASAAANSNLAVTFEVESLQELLMILEGREQIQELKIRLPSNQEFEPMGEPVLMKASDVQVPDQGGQP